MLFAFGERSCDKNPEGFLTSYLDASVKLNQNPRAT